MPEIILAVDPSLRGTGFAVLRQERGKTTCMHYGVIRNAPKLPSSACLLAIHQRITEVLVQYAPHVMAIESVIYVQSYPTAIVLGAARGAAILAGAQRGIPIHEYAPRRVKQAVVGRGAAQKAQVGFMVRALLGLTETPPPDAADAIAIGLTHIQTATAATARKTALPRI